MTTLEIRCPGKLNIRCRKGKTIQLYAISEVRTGATYSFQIYADDDTVLKEYTLQNGGIVEDGLDVKMRDYTLEVPTGTYRYRWSRETTEQKEVLVEGNIIVM